ncbi:hypothetical protein ACEXQB_013595 [Herbiconiux sp. P18]|uniref:luciferase domain-containing protein n=1 Tax=Herbiconiux liangxiaofengii TaxID=3342795 RepID=UPI0035BB44F2
MFTLPGVEEGRSQVSPVSSRAVFLVDLHDETDARTNLAPGRRLEPVHLHGVFDTSVHLCLPPERGAELAALGWAEPHQYADFGTEFMIYGPRDGDELAVVLTIVQESIAFARLGEARLGAARSSVANMTDDDKRDWVAEHDHEHPETAPAPATPAQGELADELRSIRSVGENR